MFDGDTYEAYLVALIRSHVHIDNRDWREGQRAFNVLHLMRPDLSEQIRATPLDPFHRDERLPEFLEWLKENWND
jgi:hypothetical protein